MSEERPVDSVDAYDVHKARKEYDEFVEAALRHHELTGEWPPDPLLDEIDEIRREIMAEHGGDWRKVLRWYVEQDKRFAEQNPDARFVEKPTRPVGVSGP